AREEEALGGGDGVRQALLSREHRMWTSDALDPWRRRRERLLVGTPRRVLVPEAPRAVEIDVHRRPAFAIPRGLEDAAAGLGDDPAAIEDEPVVGANEVRVNEGALVVAGARRDHLATRIDDAKPERRSREVHDDFGAGIRAASHRPVGRPEVLAHLERET